MHNIRRVWFVSDLHLDPSHKEITKQFMDLLDNCDKTVEDLYILGDLFELWIGDDDHSPFLEELLNHMQNAVKRGTRLHIMHGNRDFLIGPDFLKKSGCLLLPEEEKIDLFGTPALIMHGDTLCTADTAYLRARKFAHNKWLQRLFLLLPLRLRKKIADKARAASKNHTSTTALSIMDVAQDEVAKKMAHHGVRTLIHGHTHRPDIHHFLVKDQNHTRIVLPAWHDGGSVFEWRENGEKELIAL